MTLDTAYCAGLIDGEGCISLAIRRFKRNGRTYVNYQPKIVTEMRTPLAGRMLEATLGGRCKPYTRKFKDGRTKTIYVWRANDRSAERVLKAVMPFLREKKEQAETLLEFWQNRKAGESIRQRLSALKRPWSTSGW
jgi:hypothetical protein